MPEALRIALLTHSVNPRGGVVHTLELARALHALGHQVTVLAPAMAGQRFFRDVPHAVSLVPVGPAPAPMADMVADRIQAFVRHLGPLLRQQTFDVLHAHDGIGGNALATLAEAGAIAGFVRTVHHLDTFDEPRLDSWQRRAVTAAQQLLCVSQVWCRALQDQFGRQAALVGNGVDLARYTRLPDARDTALQQRLGLRPGAVRWLTVGGVEARKNTLRTLHAYLRLRSSHPGAQLIVAGGASLLDHSSYAAQFRALAAQAGLSVATGECTSAGAGADSGAGAGAVGGPGESASASASANASPNPNQNPNPGAKAGPGPGLPDLVLTGPLPDADMPALFRQASALAMPSLREGFGLVVLEALACGTPVVVSDRPPFTEYLHDAAVAGHALYTDPLDVAALAEAMQRAAQPARRAALARGVPPVCHHYSWAASAARHVAIYRGLHPLAQAA